MVTQYYQLPQRMAFLFSRGMSKRNSMAGRLCIGESVDSGAGLPVLIRTKLNRTTVLVY